jgi:hypothetical protein
MKSERMTIVSARFSEAVEYARAAHDGQVRKGSGIPYLYHLLAVSSLALEYGGNEDQAIAGLLHDVLEDCGAEHEAVIRQQFGDHVAAMVLACTDGTAESKAKAADPEAKRRNWWERKLHYLAQLKSKPAGTLLVSCCDKLHNARAIVRDLEDPAVGQEVFSRFTGGIDGTLRYYQSLAEFFALREVVAARDLQNVVARMHALAGDVAAVRLDHGIYHLCVWDNFLYQDEDATHTVGPFFSAEEATGEAKRRVLASLAEAATEAIGADAIYDRYTSFGEDPQVVGTPQVTFSAWDFAKEAAAQIAAGQA